MPGIPLKRSEADQVARQISLLLVGGIVLSSIRVVLVGVGKVCYILGGDQNRSTDSCLELDIASDKSVLARVVDAAHISAIDGMYQSYICVNYTNTYLPTTGHVPPLNAYSTSHVIPSFHTSQGRHYHLITLPVLDSPHFRGVRLDIRCDFLNLCLYHNCLEVDRWSPPRHVETLLCHIKNLWTSDLLKM